MALKKHTLEISPGELYIFATDSKTVLCRDLNTVVDFADGSKGRFLKCHKERITAIHQAFKSLGRLELYNEMMERIDEVFNLKN